MVTDLQESRSFYENVLSLSTERVGETSVTYDLDGSQLKVQEDFDAETLDEYNLEPPAHHVRGDGAILVIQHDTSIDGVAEHIVECIADTDGSIVLKPRSVPWGERMMLVRDPDGYVFEIRGK